MTGRWLGPTSIDRTVQLLQEGPLRTFDVPSVEIQASFELVFDDLADPRTLPEGTHAFASVDGQHATMRTPAGTAAADLIVVAFSVSGTKDWTMTSPNGQAARGVLARRSARRRRHLQLRSVGSAHSVPTARRHAGSAVEGARERAGDGHADARASCGRRRARGLTLTDVILGDLVRAASGDQRDALEELLRRLQQPIYSLAVRMLGHPEDARDATQEILIRIMTHLASFRGESRFMTWASTRCNGRRSSIARSPSRRRQPIWWLAFPRCWISSICLDQGAR